MSDPLTGGIFPLKLPLPTDLKKGWRPTRLFQGSTSILNYLSCHASSLMPGRCPHPPHCHEDEEILIMLAGEADLTLGDKFSSTGSKRRPLGPGQMVFYPSGFSHTLEARGEEPANYLMFRWERPFGKSRKSLPLTFLTFSPPERFQTGERHFHAVKLIQGETRCLRRLEAHLSFLPPKHGYEPHADHYDVALLLLKGELQTLDARVRPHDLVFYPAGSPHGLYNPGTGEACYLVFEFHGPRIPVSDSWPIRSLLQLARWLTPVSLRRRLRRFLARSGPGRGQSG